MQELVLVLLAPSATGGTSLTYEVWATPRTALGLVAIPAQIGILSAKQIDRTIRHYDGLPLDAPYAADTILVAPGERYTVLVHPDRLGTWVWHCHILNHAESANGLIGMVTALIVQ